MAGRSSSTDTATNNRPEGVRRAERWLSKRRVTPVPVALNTARHNQAVGAAMANPWARGQKASSGVRQLRPTRRRIVKALAESRSERTSMPT